MPRKSARKEPVSTRRAPAFSPEERENQMIAYAVNLAEKQLIEGTASSQVITHYLKLGSIKAKLENEKLRSENELLRAKTEALGTNKQLLEVYERACNAMLSYKPSDE